ncbi:MAG TPA: nucleoside phosphorylase [Thermoplasmata archaeon]|nr:nucleoside phosphorylase [Thermoplasmata archaeon]
MPTSVLIPGDPDRATAIAESWDDHRPLREHREFRSFRGRYRGVDVGTVSAGIGGPSMSIVVDELAQVGARTLLRVGSCGAVGAGIRGGDLVISLAAARFEGTSESFAPLGYPAVADPGVYEALRASAEDLGVRFHTGITATVGTFYPEQDRPGFAGAVAGVRERFPVRDFARLRIVNVEMECATLLTVASVFGLRAGAVCTVYGDSAGGDPVPEDPGPAIRVANEAVRRLAEGTS